MFRSVSLPVEPDGVAAGRGPRCAARPSVGRGSLAPLGARSRLRHRSRRHGFRHQGGHTAQTHVRSRHGGNIHMAPPLCRMQFCFHQSNLIVSVALGRACMGCSLFAIDISGSMGLRDAKPRNTPHSTQPYIQVQHKCVAEPTRFANACDSGTHMSTCAPTAWSVLVCLLLLESSGRCMRGRRRFFVHAPAAGRRRRRYFLRVDLRPQRQLGDSRRAVDSAVGRGAADATQEAAAAGGDLLHYGGEPKRWAMHMHTSHAHTPPWLRQPTTDRV